MKQLTRYILLVFTACAVLLASCGKHNNEEDKTTPQTIIVYMAGVDLGQYFTYNREAIKAALNYNIQGNSRIVVFYQTSKTIASLVEYSFRDGKCQELPLTTYTLPSQMNADELGNILSDIIGRTPSISHSLIIGAHGLGWIPIGANPQSSTISSNHKSFTTISHGELWERKGDIMTRFIGENSNPQNRFDVKDLSLALSSTGITMEYILFDACFMANVEALYDLRNNAKYIIGSPCEIMGTGFPYKDIMPLLLKNNGTSYDLEATCEAFYNDYKDDDTYPSGAVSIIRCSQLEPLAQAMKLVNNSNQIEYKPSLIQTFEGQSKHIFFDLGDYVNKMSDDTQAKESFNEQLNRTIITTYKPDLFYSGYGTRGKYSLKTFSGLTTSAPSDLYRESYSQTAWYKATH
mgnify:CR=1 FL=1